MTGSIKLGYLALEVRKPHQWHRFCETILGLPEPVRNADGSIGYRVDEVSQRLIVSEGNSDDLAALGIECSDDLVLDAILKRIEGAGIPVQAASDGMCRNRRVRRLHRLSDPAGNAVELYVGPEAAAAPFSSPLYQGGFRTGDAGLGHVVLNSPLSQSMERFYVDALGFGVTERLATRIGPMAVCGTFLHCNRRHHSIALFDLPIGKRLHHFMLQANELHDVGRAFERAERASLPMSLGLGQHPDPDGTFSFYGSTPSGFDFEIGAGSKEIDPTGWKPLQTDVTSAWGHKPRLRLRLKMAGGFLGRALRHPKDSRGSRPVLRV